MGFTNGIYNRITLLRAFIKLSRDPNQVESVLVMLEKIEQPELLKKLAEGVKADEATARVMAQKPLIGRIDLKAFKGLPEGTLGRAFANHIEAHQLDPNYFVTEKEVDEVSWVPARLRETHDLWHLLTGIDMTPWGEVALQAFYLAQIPSPLSALIIGAAIVNSLTRNPKQFSGHLEAISYGWAMGKRSRPLIQVPWESLWDKPLGEVRRAWDIDPEGVRRFFGREGDSGSAATLASPPAPAGAAV